ncbi:hypothetical protein M569_17670 [Genlisea aurea]|uniref:Uncharacterized protein n=1 Tax=Genlisea aurea TaxID=192259 RepID=S8BY93_9LAMI|nr:hypothetical protein M569_17670 [Genlisea aurea]
MSRPVHRLVRLKVKDLVASCFYACRFPLEEEHDDDDDTSKAKSPPPRKIGADCVEPRLSGGDYIVFCFREDGTIDLMNEYTAADSSAVDPPPPPPPPPMDDWKCHCNECLRLLAYQQQPDQEKQRIVNRPIRSDTSDSNGTSTSSSFAFPELGVEWIGSPVHMPRPEEEDRNEPTTGADRPDL